jgi:hypothetical protein
MSRGRESREGSSSFEAKFSTDLADASGYPFLSSFSAGQDVFCLDQVRLPVKGFIMFTDKRCTAACGCPPNAIYAFSDALLEDRMLVSRAARRSIQHQCEKPRTLIAAFEQSILLQKKAKGAMDVPS